MPRGPAVSVDECLRGEVAWVSNLGGLPERCAKGEFLVHSGPRRMGKSTHLAMMAAYFHRDERLLQHLRDEYKYADAQFIQEKHPVIHLSLDFTVPPDIVSGSLIEVDMQTKLVNKLLSCARALKVGVERGLAVEETFVTLLDAIDAKYPAPDWGRPAVLIDEADFCLLDAVGAGVTQELIDARVRGLGQLFHCLKGMFARLHSVFMTGVTLLYRRVGSTWLNGATFLSFPEDERSRALAPQLGFTWAQIERTLGRHLETYCTATGSDRITVQRRMSELYNGFGFGGSEGKHLFNTKSVLDFFLTGELRAHFGSLPESKAVLRVATRGLVAELMAADLGGCVLTLGALRMQTDDRESADARLALLVHNGLLTVDRLVEAKMNCVVRVPNEEMRSSFFPALMERLEQLGVPLAASDDDVRLGKLLSEGKAVEFLEAQAVSRVACTMRDLLTSSAGQASLTEPVIGTVVAFHIALLVRWGLLQLHPEFPKVVREGRNEGDEKRVDTAVVPYGLRTCLLFEYKRVPTCAPTAAAVDKELRAAFAQIDSRGYARRYLDKSLTVRPVAAVYKEDGSFERAAVGEIVRP